MPFNGAGVYSAPGADFPVVTQTVISSTHFNNTINDIATGLSLCLTKDGQQTATANINFGGFRATNVGITAIAGSVGTPAINVSDAGTGLYRSAASELAVTVAGSQVARFASTGLIVTGAASVSTTLTASTSVVTPLVGNVADVNLTFQVAGQPRWLIDTNTAFRPNLDNTSDIGDATHRIGKVVTSIIDSGTTGSLMLRTNNGTEQARVIHGASAVNFFGMQGGGTGAAVNLWFAGSDANVAAQYNLFGTGSHTWTTGSINLSGGGVTTQFQILHTASASRNITVTGSNGGNPTLSTTAGSLAITPSVVIAGANLSVGTNPATIGAISLPYVTELLSARNADNNGNRSVLGIQTVNSAKNVISIGLGAFSGVLVDARQNAGAPTTSDIPSGSALIWRDTSGATTKLYYNNAGALQSVTLA